MQFMVGDVVLAAVCAGGHFEKARVLKIRADGYCRIGFMQKRKYGYDGTMAALQRDIDHWRHESELIFEHRPKFEYKTKEGNDVKKNDGAV